MNRKTEPGRLTRAAVHSEAGEIELRLSSAGNWQLALREAGKREWRLACSGDLAAGAARLAPEPEPELTRLGRLTLDVPGRQAFAGGTALVLATLEFDLLAMLATEPGRVFSKQELMKSVWGYESLPSTRTLDSHASRLRVKLRKAGAPGYVVNIKGYGYKLWSKPA